MKKVLLLATILLTGSLSLEAKYCKNMDSCEEACSYYLKGYKGLDRDKDGIPCENVCDAPCKEPKKKNPKKSSNN